MLIDVRIDKREGERENNTFWYIKEMIERELNKAYRINIPQNKGDNPKNNNNCARYTVPGEVVGNI